MSDDASSRPLRFRRVPNATYTAINADVLIACPQCQRCAREVVTEKRYVTICSHCGFTRHSSDMIQSPVSPPVTDAALPRDIGFIITDPMYPDTYKRLWLQTPCCGHTLWARNVAHIDLLEAYIAAGLRQPELKAIVHKLPGWMIQAKHRDEVLQGLTRLRKRAADCPS